MARNVNDTDAFANYIEERIHERRRVTMPYKPQPKVDSIAIYTDLIACMDAAEKECIPGRNPWRTRREARRWMAFYYRERCDDLARHYNVGISTILKYGPGVSCSLARVSEKFEEAGL